MAYWGALIYLFFFFVRLEDWWEPVRGFPVADVLMPAIMFSLLPSLPRIVNIFRKSFQIKFFFFFILAVVASDIVNNDIDLALQEGWRYLKFIIIFFAIAFSINSFHKLRLSTIHIIILIVFIAFQGIIQANEGVNWAGLTPHSGFESRMRWVGTF